MSRAPWLVLVVAACSGGGGGVAVDGAPGSPADGATPRDGDELDAARSLTDCTLERTVPGPAWEPVEPLQIQVVVHVIADADCTTGAVSDERIASQLAVLDEDFRALAGTPGAAGVDSRIEFVLAGVTRDCDATWYQDDGDYWTTLAWDPTRYLNLYTNTAGGSRGYVPYLPADPEGPIGQPADRVVINELAFGRDGPFPPHDQGRTATHEIGHYLGLFHPYYEGCGEVDAPGCYTSGDRICDTAPDAASHDGCPASATGCDGVEAPLANYMELTDDACMTGFTAEQVQRMRCTLATYRPELGSGR